MSTDLHLRELNEHFAHWRLRLRVRAALVWAVRGLAAGLAAGLGLSLMARLAPLQPLGALLIFSISFALAGTALALVIGYFWPRPPLPAARYLDRVLDLAERTSMALELSAQPERAPDWLRREQWRDAAQAARGVDARRRLPWFVYQRRDWIILVVLISALTLSLALPNAQLDLVAQRQAVQQAIAEQIQEIEALKKQIESNTALTEEQKDALLAPLEQAQQQLSEPELTQEQALQALNEAQQELRAAADPNALAQAQALQQAGEALSQNAVTQQTGQALANGDLQSAAQELANIDPAQLSEAERQALAEQLEQAAQQLQESNPETAQALQEAANALRQGDNVAAQQALQRAAQSIAQTGQAAAQAEAAQQTASQLGQAQRAVAQAGQAQGQGQGQGQGQQGQGQGQGQGQNNNGETGGGTGSGQGNGIAQGGQPGEGNVGQPNSAGGAGREYEPIYTPYRVGGAGSEVTLPDGSTGEPGSEVVGQGNATPGEEGQVGVPYNEVFPEYRNSAYSTIDQGEYPLQLKDIVRNYFSSLEP